MMRTWSKRIKDFILLKDVFQNIHSEDIVGRQRLLLFRWFTLLGLFTCAGMMLDVYAITPTTLNFTVPLLAGLFALNYCLLNRHKNQKLSYILLTSLILVEIH